MEALSTGKQSVLSFGELLLRICLDAGGEWLKENSLPFYVGGAELNVATALALWNVPSKYFTALPDNDLSRQLLNYLGQKNIDTSAIQFSGNRIGLYFLTQGKDLKQDALVYDRANSAFSDLKPRDVNWDAVLSGVSWLHFSAICPAVSQSVADICLELLQAASIKRITISIDLNYRAKLWKYGKEPEEVIPQLLTYCDLVMGNVWAAEKMMGIAVNPNIHKTGEKDVYLQEALKTSQAIMKRYPKCKAVANTFRFDADKSIRYFTTLYSQSQLINSSEYTSEHIVDKVGSGDCFMAGLIYGFYQDWPLADTLEFSTSAAFQKLFINSDATNKTVAEIKKGIKL